MSRQAKRRAARRVALCVRRCARLRYISEFPPALAETEWLVYTL